MIHLLKAIVSLAGALASYLAARQMLAAGEARAVAAQLREVLHNVEQAERAARAVDPDDPAFDDDYARRVRDENQRQ